MLDEIARRQETLRQNILKGFADEDITKAEETELEKAHQVGDMHPNGKWVWTQLPNGKFDWRTKKKPANSKKSSTSETKQGKVLTAAQQTKYDTYIKQGKTRQANEILFSTFDVRNSMGMIPAMDVSTVRARTSGTASGYSFSDDRSQVTIRGSYAKDISAVTKKLDAKGIKYTVSDLSESGMGLNKTVERTITVSPAETNQTSKTLYSEMPIKDAKKALMGKIVIINGNSFDGYNAVDSFAKVTNVRLYGKNKTPIATIETMGGDEEDVKLSDLDAGWHSNYTDDYYKQNNIGKISIIDGSEWGKLVANAKKRKQYNDNKKDKEPITWFNRDIRNLKNSN
jgi:hypothetical protein